MLKERITIPILAVAGGPAAWYEMTQKYVTVNSTVVSSYVQA